MIRPDDSFVQFVKRWIVFEQRGLVLNQNGQFRAHFVDRVVEVMMKMVIGFDYVVRQFMQEQ